MMGEVFVLLTVGLCGGSGTGKSAAQADFALFGVPGLDTDLVYHELISGDTPLTRELVGVFGSGILSSGGGVDRSALSSLVFGDGEAFRLRREALNHIAHRAVLDECRVWLAKQANEGAFAAIINAPLLFESGFYAECDLTVAVIASRERRIERIVERDGITRERAKCRLAAQLDDHFLITHTDYYIENNGTRAELRESVKHLADVIKTIWEETKHGK